MSKPWLETWDNEFLIGAKVDQDEAACQIAMAAPDMCRVLLAVEWQGSRLPKQSYRGPAWAERCCACCENTSGEGHEPLCHIDAALTKCGLATQEQRDEARKELGI